MQAAVDRALRRDAEVSPSALETWADGARRRSAMSSCSSTSIDYVYRRVRCRALVNGRTGKTTGPLPKDRSQ